MCLVKSHLAAKPVIEACTRHILPPSRISAPIVRFSRVLLPFYFRFALHFQKIEILHPELILEELRNFQEKRTRLIVAFRHAYGDEPQLVFHVFNNLLPRWAKRRRSPLLSRPFLRIIHDYAVPLWGDALIRFILPRVGTVPIYHVKFDPASLKQIRSILSDDPNPLGLAPEGQISYHSETLPRIEQGAIRMGFWCAKDVDNAGRSEKVHVLPLSIHYQYDFREVKIISTAIYRLEITCGLSPSPIKTKRCTVSSWIAEVLPIIESIEDKILDLTEDFYARTYRRPPLSIDIPGTNAKTSRQSRWKALQAIALDAANNVFGIVPLNPDALQQVYRIRQEGWDRIYPETPVDNRPPLVTAFTDRQAGEAWHAMRHMEFVDLMYYYDPGYLQGGPAGEPSFDRIVETVTNLQDLTTRLMGGNITNRPNIMRKKAVILPATSLDLTARLPDYRKDAKQTINEVTDELSQKYINCIKEYLYETRH